MAFIPDTAHDFDTVSGMEFAVFSAVCRAASMMSPFTDYSLKQIAKTNNLDYVYSTRVFNRLEEINWLKRIKGRIYILRLDAFQCEKIFKADRELCEKLAELGSEQAQAVVKNATENCEIADVNFQLFYAQVVIITTLIDKITTIRLFEDSLKSCQNHNILLEKLSKSQLDLFSGSISEVVKITTNSCENHNSLPHTPYKEYLNTNQTTNFKEREISAENERDEKIPARKDERRDESKAKKAKAIPAEKKSKAATRIPPDFAVSVEMRLWAKEKVPDVDVETATEEFIDFWTSAVRNATKRDWTATWRNRLRAIQEKRDEDRRREEVWKAQKDKENKTKNGNYQQNRSNPPVTNTTTRKASPGRRHKI